MTHSSARFSHAAGRLSSLALSPRRACIALVAGCLAASAGLAWAPDEVRSSTVILSFALAWASAVDIDRFILPDVITLGLVLLGLGIHLASGISSLPPYVIGAAAGYLALAALDAAYQRLRGRSGLGMGDAKLVAAAGAWLGWTALPALLLAASVGCLAWVLLLQPLLGRSSGKVLHEPIQFGPYLALAFYALWIFQDVVAGVVP